AMGLLCGVSITPAWLTPALLGAMLVAVFVIDSPRLFGRYRHTSVTLDAAYPDERELVARLESMLGGSVKRYAVTKLDLVHDLTVVDVRYQLGADRAPGTTPPASVEARDRADSPSWLSEQIG
ncbi:MAG TPA: DUF4956 domain-containing protein, partial [Ilumatobacteraceae bacterium]|nr:DUF4956 domain-containing protein [Ilumatobacteraceae bacterium]